MFATFASWCCQYVVHQCAFFASCRACQCIYPQPHIMPLRQSPMCPPAWLKALSRIRSRCLMSFSSRLRSPIKSSMWSCIVCLSVISVAYVVVGFAVQEVCILNCHVFICEHNVHVIQNTIKVWLDNFVLFVFVHQYKIEDAHASTSSSCGRSW